MYTYWQPPMEISNKNWMDISSSTVQPNEIKPSALEILAKLLIINYAVVLECITFSPKVCILYIYAFINMIYFRIAVWICMYSYSRFLSRYVCRPLKFNIILYSLLTHFKKLFDLYSLLQGLFTNFSKLHSRLGLRRRYLKI